MDGFCPLCSFYRAHGARCPSQLRTREQRIERAAHLFSACESQHSRTICQEDGISEPEQHQGVALAEARRHQYAAMVAYLGDPSYGGWTPELRECAPQKRSARIDTNLPDESVRPGRNVALANATSEVIPIMATAPATANTPRTPREVVEFPPNVPVTVALKYGHAKTVSSQYGERFMFSLADGRVMFLAPEVGGKIEALGVNVRENFTIIRKVDEQQGSSVTWEVARVAGEQPNGTFVVPTALSKPAASATAPTNDASRRQSALSPSLVEEANSLVDSFAAVLDHALTKYQGRIKPEEAKALLITAYIQRSKYSSVA
jgi:hypothetical protein